MRFVLIAGLWLDGSASDHVASELQLAGHDPVAVTLPGQGDGNVTATLEDQVAAVLDAIDAGGQGSVVVGHSAAATLAWIAADRRPDRVAATVMVGGFPSDHGTAYAAFFEASDGMVQFPGWAAFEGPDSADLDAAARDRMAAAAIPVPATVTEAPIALTDPRRFGVPVTIICPEFSPAQAREWIGGGEVPALTGATRIDYVDIDSGHWPMLTRPAELAQILAAL